MSDCTKCITGFVFTSKSTDKDKECVEFCDPCESKAEGRCVKDENEERC